MPEFFPAIEPHAEGMLDVGDGATMYWESSGNPEGRPTVVLHGGPGGASSPGARKQFDPDVHRVIQLDQRGSGRSRPLAEAVDADLSTNTTQHLIADIELLREHLGIERWGVYGMSWGTTLGLAYAEAHQSHVRSITLALVTTTTRREVEWLTVDVGRIFPEEWRRFATFVPPHLRDRRLVDAYAELLFDADPAVRAAAAASWCDWEDAHVSLAPGHKRSAKYDDDDYRLRFARLVTHYWRNAAFLGENELLDGAPALSGIPTTLIHGRWDVSSPLETAYDLAAAIDGAELVVIEDAGHGDSSAFGQAMLDAHVRMGALG